MSYIYIRKGGMAIDVLYLLFVNDYRICNTTESIFFRTTFATLGTLAAGRTLYVVSGLLQQHAA